MAWAGLATRCPRSRLVQRLGSLPRQRFGTRVGRQDRRIVTPQIEEAEQLQGFPRQWTEPANEISNRKGTRWKLVGNAVTAGVSRWVGERLMQPGAPLLEGRALERGESVAHSRVRGERKGMGRRPVALAAPRRHINTYPMSWISTRRRGFPHELLQGSTAAPSGRPSGSSRQFISDIAEHAAFMAAVNPAAQQFSELSTMVR